MTSCWTRWAWQDEWVSGRPRGTCRWAQSWKAGQVGPLVGKIGASGGQTGHEGPYPLVPLENSFLLPPCTQESHAVSLGVYPLWPVQGLLGHSPSCPSLSPQGAVSSAKPSLPLLPLSSFLFLSPRADPHPHLKSQHNLLPGPMGAGGMKARGELPPQPSPSTWWGLLCVRPTWGGYLRVKKDTWRRGSWVGEDLAGWRGPGRDPEAGSAGGEGPCVVPHCV